MIFHLVIRFWIECDLTCIGIAQWPCWLAVHDFVKSWRLRGKAKRVCDFISTAVQQQQSQISYLLIIAILLTFSWLLVATKMTSHEIIDCESIVCILSFSELCMKRFIRFVPLRQVHKDYWCWFWFCCWWCCYCCCRRCWGCWCCCFRYWLHCQSALSTPV